MRKRLLAAVAASAALASVMLAPGAQAAGPTLQRTVYDDFSSGFQTTGTGAKWFLVPTGTMTAGDGIPTTSGSGLNVVPTGTNPVTGNPAFAYTTPPESAGGDGSRDELKWVTMTTHQSSYGYPGFDAPVNGQVGCDIDMASRTTGTAQNPFGISPQQAAGDLRLGSGVAMATDSETDTVFDFYVTDTTVYAYYERLRMPGTTYAAFSYAVPVATRTPGENDDYQMVLDRNSGKATWVLNGRTVLTVDKIGTLELPRKYLLIDHGGTQQQVFPRQLNCGVGMFTLLDGASQNGQGLVQLDSTPGFYYNPLLGQPAPESFLDETSQAQDRLWGEGVDLNVHSVSVLSGQS